MLKQYLSQLYAYNDWANKKILNLLEKNKVQDEFCNKFFSHTINAQFIWHKRVSNLQNDYKIWDIWTHEQMTASLEDNYLKWQAYLAQVDESELQRRISYQNSAGDSFDNCVFDCVVHLVNHATYHRAQVAKRLRDIDIVPENTDYITYCRVTGL